MNKNNSIKNCKQIKTYFLASSIIGSGRKQQGRVRFRLYFRARYVFENTLCNLMLFFMEGLFFVRRAGENHMYSLYTA